jgi:hypothetical protein
VVGDVAIRADTRTPRPGITPVVTIRVAIRARIHAFVHAFMHAFIHLLILLVQSMHSISIPYFQAHVTREGGGTWQGIPSIVC